MRNSPWIQQPRTESAPPIHHPRDPPPISKKEQDEIIERLSRPTESALYKRSLCWKLDSYMDRGYHSWTKLDLFRDWKNCLWTPDGTVKTTYKLRPHKLPVLKCGHSDGQCYALDTPRPGQALENYVATSPRCPSLITRKCDLSNKSCSRGKISMAKAEEQNLFKVCVDQKLNALPCIR